MHLLLHHCLVRETYPFKEDVVRIGCGPVESSERRAAKKHLESNHCSERLGETAMIDSPPPSKSSGERANMS